MLSPPGGDEPRPPDTYSEWLLSAVEAVLVSRLSPPSRGISRPIFEPPHLSSQAPSFLSIAPAEPSFLSSIPRFSSSSFSPGVSSSSGVSVPPVPSFGIPLSRIPSLRSSLLASPVLSPPYSSPFSFTVDVFLYLPISAASNALMSCESDITFYPQSEMYPLSDSISAAQPSPKQPFCASFPVLHSLSKSDMPTGHSASKERVSSSCPDPLCFGHSASDIRNSTLVMDPKTRTAEYRGAEEKTYLCVLLERWRFSFSLPSLHGTAPGIASNQCNRYPIQSEILHRNLSTAFRAFLVFAHFLPTYSALASATSLLFPPGQDGEDSIVLSSLTLEEGPHEGVHRRAEQRRQAGSVTPREENVERMKVASGEMLLMANIRESPRTLFKEEDFCALPPTSHSCPVADSPLPPLASPQQPFRPSADRVSVGGTNLRDSRTASPTRLDNVSASPRREHCDSYAQHPVSEEASSWCSVFPYGNALDSKAPPLFSAHSQECGSFSSRSCFLQSTPPSWKLEASVNVSFPNPYAENKGRPCLSLFENSTPLAAYASASTPDFHVTMQQQRGIFAEGNVTPARVAASLIPSLGQPRRQTTQQSVAECRPSCFRRSESAASEACYGGKRLASRRSPQESSEGAAGSLLDQSRRSAKSPQTPADCHEPSEAKTMDNFSDVPAFSIPFGEGTLSCSVAFREDLAFAIQSTAEASGSTLFYESNAPYSRPRYFDRTLSRNSSRENFSERSAAENAVEVNIPHQQENRESPLDRSRCIPSGLREPRYAVNAAAPLQSEDNEKHCHTELGSGRSATARQDKKDRSGGSQTSVPLLSGGREGISLGNPVGADFSKCPIYEMEAVGNTNPHSSASSSTTFSSQADVGGSRVDLSRSPYRHSGKEPSIQASGSAQEISTDCARPVSETGKVITSDNTKSPTTGNSSSRSERNSAGFLGVQDTSSSNDGDLPVGEGRFSRDSGVKAGRREEKSESRSPASSFDPSLTEDGLLASRRPAAVRGELSKSEGTPPRTSIHAESVCPLTGPAFWCYRPLADSGVGPASSNLDNRQQWSERGGRKEVLPAAACDIAEELATNENDVIGTVSTLRAREAQSPDVGEDRPDPVSSSAGSTELSTSVAARRNSTPGEQTETAWTSRKSSLRLEASSRESSFGEPGLSRYHLEDCKTRTAPLVVSTEVNPSAEARARWGLLLQRAAPSSAQESAPASGTPPSVIHCSSDYTLRIPLPSTKSPAPVDFPFGSFPWSSPANLFFGARQERETARRRRSHQAVDWIQAEKEGYDRRPQYGRVTGGAGRAGSTPAVLADGELDAEFYFKIDEKARLSKEDQHTSVSVDRGKNTVPDEGPRERVSTRRRDRAVIVLDRDHEEEESDDDEESEFGSVSSFLGARKTGRRQEERGIKQVDFWSDWTKEEMDYEHYAFPSVSKEYRRKHLVDQLASLRSGYLARQGQTDSRTPGESEEHQGYGGTQVGATTSEEGGSARGIKISEESADWDTEQDGLFFSFWVSPDPVLALSYLDATRVPLEQDPEDETADQSTGNTERDEERRRVDGEEDVWMNGKKEGGEEEVSRQEKNSLDVSTISNLPPSSGPGFSLKSYVEEAANPPSGWTRGAWRDALEKIRFGGFDDFLEAPNASSCSFATSLCHSRSSSHSASAVTFEGRTCPVLPGITVLSSSSSSAPSASAVSPRCLLPHASSSISLPSSPTSSGISGSSTSCGSAVSSEHEEHRLFSAFLSELQQDDAPFLFTPSFPHAGYHGGAHSVVAEKSRLAGSKEAERSRHLRDPKTKVEDALHLFSHLTQLLLVPELPVQETSAASASREARRTSPLVRGPVRGEGERKIDTVVEAPYCTASVSQLSQEKDASSTPRGRIDDGLEHERTQTGKKPEKSKKSAVDAHQRERTERNSNCTRSGRKSHVESSSSRRSKDSDWQRQLRFLEKQLAYFTVSDSLL
ncbi:hypothetical protein CSUI_002849 [Cystoisospora suis]|uniref:Uncharacterized protein n=1 Tax=Cystoisospora suis TaxID=483139 RepID=A0A2C6L7G9_9APIC|nr:hypothetical protein CSUI_002849 [Cystoisospora suis]